MAAKGGVSQAARDLIQQGDQLFAKRSSLMSLWQEVADNFYPERADFTSQRSLGEDFASNLSSSYPIIVRRELGSSLAAVSRRKDTEWFKVSVKRADRLDNSGREWLEWATGVQRSAMYDIDACFERATTESDHDYASFGQCVLSTEVVHGDNHLLYRCHHLRDVAWCENEKGKISDRHHNLSMSARDMVKKFGKDKVHHKVAECLQPRKNPYTEFRLRRIILPAGNYDDLSKGRKLPWVSIYIDIDNQHILQEVAQHSSVYIIPRWQTVSGSQYAYSPAVVAGLPDARLIQAMTLTMLEAGEMAVRPPMTAVGEVIQGGIQLFAGGITQVDAAYDERMGRPLQPVLEGGNLPFGLEVLESKQQMLAQAFYLNKLRSLPPKEMTAYEASVWTREWIREATPLFSPLESEYNAQVCEFTFEDLVRNGAFGPWQDIPQSIRKQDVEWKFESPLSEAIERQKGEKFVEAKALIAEAVALDPSCAAILDARKALRDALSGISIPAKWMRSERQVEQHAAQQAQQQAAEQEAMQMNQGADTAQKVGKAAESMAKVA